MSEQRPAVSEMIEKWISVRAELEALERAEHPDITDKYDRVWVWKSKELYTHCGMAWTQGMIDKGLFTLPRVHYAGMCSTCCAGHDHADGG